MTSYGDRLRLLPQFRPEETKSSVMRCSVGSSTGLSDGHRNR